MLSTPPPPVFRTAAWAVFLSLAIPEATPLLGAQAEDATSPQPLTAQPPDDTLSGAELREACSGIMEASCIPESAWNGTHCVFEEEVHGDRSDGYPAFVALGVVAALGAVFAAAGVTEYFLDPAPRLPKLPHDTDDPAAPAARWSLPPSLLCRVASDPTDFDDTLARFHDILLRMEGLPSTSPDLLACYSNRLGAKAAVLEVDDDLAVTRLLLEDGARLWFPSALIYTSLPEESYSGGTGGGGSVAPAPRGGGGGVGGSTAGEPHPSSWGGRSSSSVQGRPRPNGVEGGGGGGGSVAEGGDDRRLPQPPPASARLGSVSMLGSPGVAPSELLQRQQQQQQGSPSAVSASSPAAPAVAGGGGGGIAGSPAADAAPSPAMSPGRPGGGAGLGSAARGGGESAFGASSSSPAEAAAAAVVDEGFMSRSAAQAGGGGGGSAFGAGGVGGGVGVPTAAAAVVAGGGGVGAAPPKKRVITASPDPSTSSEEG